MYFSCERAGSSALKPSMQGLLVSFNLSDSTDFSKESSAVSSSPSQEIPFWLPSRRRSRFPTERVRFTEIGVAASISRRDLYGVLFLIYIV